MKNNKFRVLLIFMVLTFLVIGCSSKSSDTESESSSNDSESNSSNVESELNIALNSQPPTLDQPISTASVTRDVGRLLFETLVTTDKKYNVVPMLAESIDISEDSKTYTFKLREGVKFHNDKEMIAEDVIASMERWAEKSSITGTLFEGSTWNSDDDYSIVLNLEEPSSLILDTLASSKQSAAIMPKDIVESAGAEGVSEYIGTGPFQFEEWKQDQYIHLKKFDDYQALKDEADGLSGNKAALVDDMYFHVVEDASTRLSGLQTEQYDFAYGIPFDNYDQILNADNLEPVIAPSANDLLAFNKVEGISSDLKMRQVVNTAVDADEVMLGAFRNEDLYELDSGYMNSNIENWSSDAGNEYYNQNDPEKAKEMLEEIGYDGEEFRILTTRDYGHLYNIGIIIQEQLKEIGINAELEVYDWPTALEMQENDTESWDAFVTSSQIVSTPPQLIMLSPTWGGGFEDSKVADLMKSIEVAPTQEEARANWEELQLYAWEELLPVINLGSNNRLDSANKKVEGLTDSSGPIFWNVEKKK